MNKLKRKKIIKSISKERISILLDNAFKIIEKNEERAIRYIKLAFSIVKKNKVKLSKEQKIRFCRKCFIPWIFPKNVKIFFDHNNKRILYKCKKCGFKKAFCYKKPFA